jgi:diguanylate cyclase (GGDEF)-like protein
MAKLSPQVPALADPLQSEYALAQRTDRETLLRQQQLWLGNEGMRLVSEALPNLILVLNSTRQAVYANSQVKMFGEFNSPQSYLGLRPGEMINCVHAAEGPGGCGTTPFCRECGAVNAILTSLIGRKDSAECSIQRTDGRGRLELRVLTTPVRLEEEDYVIFSIQDIRLEKDNRRLLEEVQRLAVLDPLTAVLNRRVFFEDALREFVRGVRYQRTMTVLMFDVDGLKAVNDTLGHQAGDALLRAVALDIRVNLREVDLFARYGGDEFIALLPEAGLSQGNVIAQRIVEAVALLEVPAEDGAIHPAITAGAAEFLPEDPSLEVLIARADADLLRQKRLKRHDG